MQSKAQNAVNPNGLTSILTRQCGKSTLKKRVRIILACLDLYPDCVVPVLHFLVFSVIQIIFKNYYSGYRVNNFLALFAARIGVVKRGMG